LEGTVEMPNLTENEAVVSHQDDTEEVHRILLQLNAVVKNSRLYPQEHPLLKESNAKLFSLLQKQVEKRGSVVLRFIENQVVFHTTPLYEISGVVSGFVRRCYNRRFQGFTFAMGLSIEELVKFVSAMIMPAEEIKEKGGMQEELLSRGVHHIIVEKMVEQEDEFSDDEERKLAKEVYVRTLSEVRKAMDSVRLGQAIANVEGVREVVNDMLDSLLRRKSALLGLTAIKDYDDYTFQHSVNVGILSLGLGSHLSLQRDMLEGLGVGGLLHDIGKISIPERILNKPGKLDNHEWSLMRGHPVDGARILRKTRGISNCAPVVAFEHHIKYDLSGYPSLVKRRPLSSYSLVVGIADCYDAMTTLRPYQKPRTPAEALGIMLELIGRDFEPRLMNRFLEMIGTYPVGSFVRLDTNEFAVVYSINPEDAERPTVKVIIDSKGEKMTPVEMVDLGSQDPETGHYQRSIVQVLDPISKGIDISSFL
jgi:HD-GYP domain-containing protein (c-di-GMP phosphodiesterase class II)